MKLCKFWTILLKCLALSACPSINTIIYIYVCINVCERQPKSMGCCVNYRMNTQIHNIFNAFLSCETIHVHHYYRLCVVSFCCCSCFRFFLPVVCALDFCVNFCIGSIKWWWAVIQCCLMATDNLSTPHNMYICPAHLPI